MNEILCTHCGEPCEDDLITKGQLSFCCLGCETVYELLKDHDLCDYYQISPSPGIKIKGKRNHVYAFLDELEVIDKLVRRKPENLAFVCFHLPQIHCASCVWLLENLYKFHEGIVHSRINFSKKEISIDFRSDAISLRQLVEILSNIGYSPEINLGTLEHNKLSKNRSSQLSYQIGVAGFVFGNIMLFSFPEYLGLAEADEENFVSLFGYLNILLALPALFFSGSDYLKSAWNGIRYRHLNIDVPLVMGMIALFLRSTWEILTGVGAGYMDSLAGLIFFLLLGKWFQKFSYENISFDRDYKSYFPVASTKIDQEGVEKSISLDAIECGDLLVLRYGELIPADGILIDGMGKLDYSFVTGESDIQGVSIGDKVYAGGKQMGSTIHIRVERRVSQSYLTSLWNDIAFDKKGKPAMSRLADKMGTIFTYAILIIASGAFFFWLPKDSSVAIQSFSAVLIIACPCAVALSIPFIFGNALRVFGKNGVYLKNIGVVEQFSSIDTVVFDKTGTITSGTGQELAFEGEALDLTAKNLIYSAAFHSTHPVSRQIVKEWKGQLIPSLEWEETPGIGIEAVIDDRLVAVGKNGIKIDNQWVGKFSLKSQYRKGLNEVSEFFRKHFQLYLVSGDHPKDENILTKFIGDPSRLFFNKKPEEKLAFIDHLQSEGRQVMMIGDGLNDSGALMKSDLGIVITESDNNFTPACDGILKSDHFARLPQLYQFARDNKSMVKVAYFIAFIYNIIGLSFAVQGLLSPVIAAILMPLSSVSVVFIGVMGSNIVARRNGLNT
jgi:P-type Cu+ transporter